MRAKTTSNPALRGIKHGYRSGLEKSIGAQLDAAGLEYEYETRKIEYTKPESKHKYLPDFWLPNGVIVETKGIFDSDDRAKHLLLREQHPELDIRLVFSNSKARLYKGSPTTYAAWCAKNGIKFADKRVPEAWLQEEKKT